MRIELPHDPGIPPPGRGANDQQGSQRGVYTLTLTAASFTVAKGQSTPTAHWKMAPKTLGRLTHSAALFRLRKEETPPRAPAPTDLEAPRERRQSQSNERPMTPCSETSHRQQTGLCQGLGEGWGVGLHRGQRFSLGGREVLEVLLLTVDSVLPTAYAWSRLRW